MLKAGGQHRCMHGFGGRKEGKKERKKKERRKEGKKERKKEEIKKVRRKERKKKERKKKVSTWKERIQLETLAVHISSLTYSQIYFQLNEKFIALMQLHASATKCSLLQGNTVMKEKCSVPCSLSALNGELYTYGTIPQLINPY